MHRQQESKGQLRDHFSFGSDPMPKTNGIPAELRRGVLFIAFPGISRTKAEEKKIESLKEWVIEASQEANLRLEIVQGEFDGNVAIVDKVMEAIERAEVAIACLYLQSPYVMFESGCARALRKPILYLAQQGEQVPAFADHVERVEFEDFSPQERRRLVQAITRSLERADRRGDHADHCARLWQQMAARTFTPGLMERIVSQSIKRFVDQALEWQDGGDFKCMNAQAVLETGTLVMRSLKHSGFATWYYPGQASWGPDDETNTEDEYIKAQHEAVERIDRSARERGSQQDGSFTRVYVLGSLAQLEENKLRELARADVAAGIRALYVLKSELPDPNARDYGLWDDELFCEVHYIDLRHKLPRLKSCVFSASGPSLSRGQEWRDHILESRSVRPCPSLPTERALLGESFTRFMDGEDENYCSHGEREGEPEPCAWYHGSWQLLRLANVVSTPAWHSDFYRDSFHDWSRDRLQSKSTDRKWRILISGAADYGMLYHVIQALDQEGHARGRKLAEQCEFVVLDPCDTPLHACVWLQTRLTQLQPSLLVNLIRERTRILDYRPDEKFDLITSDAFLTRFEKSEEKSAVFAKWIELLDDGGWIVTTARKRDQDDDITESDRETFVNRAMRALGNVGSGVRPVRMLDDSRLQNLVKAYATKIRSFPVTKVEMDRLISSVRHLCSSETVRFARLADREMATVTEYARIVLKKR